MSSHAPPSPPLSLSFFFSSSSPLRALHSFPTRRSSDLTFWEVRSHLCPSAMWFGDPATAARLAGRAWELAHAMSFEQIGRATSELQSPMYLVCRLLLEKKKQRTRQPGLTF